MVQQSSQDFYKPEVIQGLLVRNYKYYCCKQDIKQLLNLVRQVATLLGNVVAEEPSKWAYGFI